MVAINQSHARETADTDKWDPFESGLYENAPRFRVGDYLYGKVEDAFRYAAAELGAEGHGFRPVPLSS